MASFYKYLGSPERQTFKEFITGQFQSEFWPAEIFGLSAPRYKYIYDSHDRLMVDYLGKFETLQADFNSVCENFAACHIHRSRTSVNRSCTAGCVGCFRRSCPEPGRGPSLLR